MKAEIKNIAIIVPSLSDEETGKTAALLSRELENYYNVFLFLLNVKEIRYKYGGTIVQIGQFGPFYDYDISVMKKKYHIDCAISFLENMNFANIRTRGKERVLIYEKSVQSLETQQLAAQILKIKRYYDYADAIITCSEGIKFDLLHDYEIHNDIAIISDFIEQNDIISKSAENSSIDNHGYMEQYTNRDIANQWRAVIEKERKNERTDIFIEENRLLDEAKHIVVYGAGVVGKSSFLRLSKRYKIDCFVVTKRKNGENSFLDVPIYEIRELEYTPDDTTVIIGVYDNLQDEVVNTLKKFDFSKIVFPFIEPLNYIYYTNCLELDIKSELQDLYRMRMGEDIDIDHPKTFNQKLQWMKLYDNIPIKTLLSDKYQVREWVAEKIGAEYLVPLLGVWDSFDDIDFDKLPNCFVLKCTHGSGMNVIVNDKSQFDLDMAKRKFANWMQMNYAYSGFEMNYANIKPRIIAEKMLGAEEGKADIPDYKLMCFHGEVKCSFVCSERFSTGLLKVTFYDSAWKTMPFERHYPRSEYPIDKPQNYDKMVKLAERLASDLIFVRVDFYEVNGKIYFGELTFYPGSGMEEFAPPEWDKKLGDWIHLADGRNCI